MVPQGAPGNPRPLRASALSGSMSRTASKSGIALSYSPCITLATALACRDGLLSGSSRIAVSRSLMAWAKLAQFPVGHAPVVVEGGVSRVQGDGPVEVPQRPARVAHLGVGASPVVVGNRVARLQSDGPVEVCTAPARSPSLARHASRL